MSADTTAEDTETEDTTSETDEDTTSETDEVKPDDSAAKIAALEAQLAEAAPILQAHKDAEESRKTSEEKLREELATAQRERDAANRLVILGEVAEATGLSAKVVKHLTGATKEELLAAAKDVAEGTTKRSATSSRPNPTVGGGTDAKATDSDEIDPAKLAEAIAKRVRF